nr:HAMP domain-containing histidine kinase [Rhizobiaceae bacterium]
TILFVLIAEVLIFVPSVAHFRLNWLEGRLSTAATVSTLLFEEKIEPTRPLVSNDVLMALGVKAIIIRSQGRSELQILNDLPQEVSHRTDLTTISVPRSILDAFGTFFADEDRVIAYSGIVDAEGGRVEVVASEKPLRDAMLIYARNVTILSLLISFITAALVFFALGRLVLNPVRRMTDMMARFARAPEDRANIITPSVRGDEIGRAERNLADMQQALTQALEERKRLANLGLAVSKINHDMRNLLASAQLISDRLADAEDPTVAKLAPKLVGALDRAVRYSENVLAYGRAREAAPVLRPVDLRAMVEDVFSLVAAGMPGASPHLAFDNAVPPGFSLHADPDQMFRVLLNLVRNAAQALGQAAEVQPRIRVEAEAGNPSVRIRVSDNGPGLPNAARAHLFEAFAGSARAGGTGLGLAIAREITQSHGGELTLVESRPGATVFEIKLPL